VCACAPGDVRLVERETPHAQCVLAGPFTTCRPDSCRPQADRGSSRRPAPDARGRAFTTRSTTIRPTPRYSSSSVTRRERLIVNAIGLHMISWISIPTFGKKIVSPCEAVMTAAVSAAKLTTR